MTDLQRLIRDVPDFPKPGIVFKDITPLLRDAKGFAEAVEGLGEPIRGRKIDAIVGVESRGFIFAAALAVRMGVGFVPVRKPRKLPWRTLSASYELEYGSDAIEIHADALRSGESVLLVDDLLATGGTAEACGRLVRGLGAKVEACSFVIELGFLKGRDRLKGTPVHSLLRL
ncbi:MAG TPA: adenine phosphoribosyltransferase [Planctomycetota bacterium]|jgi:adenine phosphoribosyltransferase|nr:adenine phosphoribosyltransferase [Planctomycetota bacterium]